VEFNSAGNPSFSNGGGCQKEHYTKLNFPGCHWLFKNSIELLGFALIDWAAGETIGLYFGIKVGKKIVGKYVGGRIIRQFWGEANKALGDFADKTANWICHHIGSTNRAFQRSRHKEIKIASRKL
jgi:hypothetical protein